VFLAVFGMDNPHFSGMQVLSGHGLVFRAKFYFQTRRIDLKQLATLPKYRLPPYNHTWNVAMSTFGHS